MKTLDDIDRRLRALELYFDERDHDSFVDFELAFYSLRNRVLDLEKQVEKYRAEQFIGNVATTKAEQLNLVSQ